MAKSAGLPPVKIDRTEVDLLVIGSGTGLATALAAKELGLSVAVAEKTDFVGGSTARSGGAFWIPANTVLKRDGGIDSLDRAAEYVDSLVGDKAPKDRWQAFLDHGAHTVTMLERMTDLKFFWAKGYSDYHPERPGGSAVGRSCEARAFNLSSLGENRARFQPATMASSLPMAITGADYKWLNLISRVPLKAFPRAIASLAQGLGGKILGREYVAGGQAITGGMYAGALKAGIPVWTEASMEDLIFEDGKVTGAVLTQNGKEHRVFAKHGVVLATGGFDHDLAMRQEEQSSLLTEDHSLGADGNTGDGIEAGRKLGAKMENLDQSWWFPAVAPLKAGNKPMVLLAERSLPGSLIVDRHGRRFINEATDYMSFGQEVVRRHKEGDPVGDMWLIFDQPYRDSYILAGQLFPRMPIPESWYEAGIAHRADNIAALATSSGLDPAVLEETLEKYNSDASAGTDSLFGKGQSAYDRYYGDPTNTPNPNLRPLGGNKYYAVKVVLSDLGTCGGLMTSNRGQVIREDGSVIDGLYAQGNAASNIFGQVYPGAGATIGQGLVYGSIIANDAADSSRVVATSSAKI